MALEKQQLTNQGVTADYWRVASIIIQPKKSVRVGISLYLSHEARLAGAEPLLTKDYIFEELNPIDLAPVSYVYGKLKAVDDFANAKDV